MSQPCPGSQEGQPHPGGVSSRVRGIVLSCPVLLCSALGQPQLRCWGSFEHHHTKDIRLLEAAQRRPGAGEGSGEEAVRGAAEGTWLAQPAGEDTEVRPRQGLHHPPEEQQKGRHRAPHSCDQ